MALNWSKRLWQYFLEFNLYKNATSDIHTAHKERLATRIYVCSLFAAVLIITVVAASLLRTVDKTEYSPSHERFSYLAKMYPATISCPCSTIGTPYSAFITTHARFHQVCSSQFVEKLWIDLVFTQQNNTSFSSNDFRKTLSFFWQVIAGLCSISNTTWFNSVADFNASRSINPLVVNEQTLRTEAQTILNNIIYIAQSRLNLNLVAIRQVISGNQLVSALATNFYLRYPPNDFTTTTPPRLSPRVYDDCSCLRSQGCPRPVTITDVHEDLIMIPGMVADCYVMDGTLASTLECYYNHSCLSLLHPNLPIPIKPLSDGSNKHFNINSTVQMLLNEIMIDEITTDIRFDLFYSQCNPAYCFYSYAKRFDILFVATTIIGIFGGVSFVLRMIARFLAAMILRWKDRKTRPNNILHVAVPGQRRVSVRIILNQLQASSKRLGQVIINLNLFQSQGPYTPTKKFRELLLTRLFLLLLLVSSAAAGFYTFLLAQSQLVTITQPSLAIYQQLYNDHASSLQCPCSQQSISYGSFLNVTFDFHEVCSSDLVSSEWLNYLASFDPITLPWWAVSSATRDFRTAGNAYFQLLSIFCSLAKLTVKDAQSSFNNTRFVNNHILSPPLFSQQANAIIGLYLAVMASDFSETILWMMLAVTDAFFLTGTNTNSNITFYNNNTINIGKLSPELIDGISPATRACQCPVESTGCFTANLLYTVGTERLQYEQNLRELTIGCSPISGFLLSTIHWLYNQTFLEKIRDTYSRVIHSQSPPTINSLNYINSSVPDVYRFHMVAIVIILMFIEPPIRNETSFDLFYNQCAPESCSYEIVQRRDLFIVLLILISICGGLNKILRLLVQAFGKLIFLLIDWWKNRGNEHANQSATAHLKHLLNFIFKAIISMNLYKTESVNEIDVQQQRSHTRIYIILFAICLGIILFYTAVVERSITRKHAMPSIEEYEQLFNLHSYGVSCPCTQISIPYQGIFTELDVKAYHQGCLIDQAYIPFVTGTDQDAGNAFDNGRDLRKFISLFYIGFDYLCQLAKRDVQNSIAAFKGSSLFAQDVISRLEFHQEINATLIQFQQRLPIQFGRTLNLIRITIQGNALMSAFSANWQFVFADQERDRNASFRTEPVIYVDKQQNTSCSCATSGTCTMPAQFFDGNQQVYYTIEGYRVACYPLETALQSSFSCLYSRACFSVMLERLHMFNESLMTNPAVTNMFVFNARKTRFSINDTLETLANQMFIESWTSNASYERFFNICAPSYCTYRESYRFDAVELLTTFLSVYVGLSLGIRIIVPLLMKRIKKIRNHFRVAPAQ